LQSAQFLVPDTTVHENGTGAPVRVEAAPVLITLGILNVVEQESLILSIYGSQNGTEWNPEPLVSFPEKYYPGVSAVYVDPAVHQAQFIRAQWKVNRWGRGSKTASFHLYMAVEPL
jgi:hypothetical protein